MRQQFMVLAITLFSLPFYYISLEIPKKIINGALNTNSASYLDPVGFFGVEFIQLDREPLLYTLCAIYFVLVVINGGLKYFINVFKKIQYSLSI